jgi:nitroreductase
MLAKQTLDLIKRRRTSRYFDKYSEVSKQSLERILEAAIWAPFSIYQLQDWKFIVLTEKARDQATEIILEDPTVLKYIRVMYENTSWGENDKSWLKLIEDFGKDLGGAPVLVVALALHDPNKHHRRHNIASLWCAAQNMLLQTSAEGLDSGIISFISEKMEDKLTKFLGYDPKEYFPAYVLNIGEAQKTPGTIPREKKDVIIYKSE